VKFLNIKLVVRIVTARLYKVNLKHRTHRRPTLQFLSQVYSVLFLKDQDFDRMAPKRTKDQTLYTPDVKDEGPDTLHP
jgi:hypothetical protein